MPRVLRISHLVALLAAAVAARGAADSTGAPTLRPVTRIYAELCASCHGQRWEGGRAPTMLDDVWAHGGDDDSLAKSIRVGYIENAMPPFGAVMNPSEIRAMVVFIRESRERAKQEKKAPPPDVNGLAFTTEKHSFKIERVADGLQTPWGMSFLPNGQMLVTERPGRVRIIEPGKGIVGSVTGIPQVWLRQDGGLLDLIVHPDYARNGWIYLAFSDTGGTERNASSTRIVRGKIRDGAWVDQQLVFEAPQAKYWVSNTHYGTRFLFDKAGYLYFGIGDRGRRDEAQDLTSPYGKLHRVKDDGSVPADNPFVNTPGADKTIWSFGHRNQQGLAQHPVTGAIWATEHGPRGGDELNLIAKSKNFGWPVITYGMNDDGTPITDITAKDGMEQPVEYWTPSIAVSAIEFYTGDKFPRWKNDLFLASLTGKMLTRLVLENNKVVRQEVILRDLARMRDVVTGPDGLIYVSLNEAFNDSPGQIIRLVPTDK